MQSNELYALWELILADVKPVVSAGTYTAFFKPSVLLSLDERAAVISTPSFMIMDHLQKRHTALLQELIEKHVHMKVPVEMIIRSAPVSHATHADSGPLFEEKKVLPRSLSRVRADYTFETMAVSQSNQLAYVSAKNVSEHLGQSYNPLFIYGPVGVGKTHLMQAIANAVYDKNPADKIVYITSEEFTNEVVEAIRGNSTSAMKKRFRSARLLIIDDIQFIAGKDKVQEELFHTFNILIDNSAQIVLSSDKPPSEIKKLEARLSSRFAGGLTVDIEAPDFEMRTAIALKKAEKLGFDLPIEVAKIIAEKQQDVRSLEGDLLRVITESSAKQQEITASLATHSLEAGDKEKKLMLHPDEIIKVICEIYRIKQTQLKGPKRDASLVKVRQITMYVLKQQLGMTHADIGNLLGGRDHTTVMHGVEKMASLVMTNPHLHEEILGITQNLRG